MWLSDAASVGGDVVYGAEGNLGFLGNGPGATVWGDVLLRSGLLWATGASTTNRIEGSLVCRGGLPVGSSVVLQGPPGQEKLRFALTFLAEGLKSGGSGLVVTSSQSPDAVIAELRELGVNLDSVTNENRLRVVDWYSWSEETVQDIEDRGIVIRSSIDLTNLGVALSRAIAALTGGESRRAVIELLSPATSSYEVTQVYAFAQSAKRKFDRHQFTSLVLLEKEMHSSAQLTTLHQPFDGVVEIERTRSGDRIVRKIGVLHLKDTAPDPTFRVLEMSEAGMRVVQDTPKPGAPGSTARGSVLESQDERAQRLRLIMQIATERLKLNPGDADALFAMAAAQATLDDAKGGLETLDRLADLDSAYPGLWVLKTKLHAKLGQSELAQKSRLRAQQTEPEAAEAIDATVPCPMCEAPVAMDATTCANCGVKFTPTRTLEDELDDLVEGVGGPGRLQLIESGDYAEVTWDSLGVHPRAKIAVLNAVADRVGWGKPAPAGVYRGLAHFRCFASYVAAAAEITVSGGNKVKVRRIVCATDPGYAVNPAQIERQIAGSFVYGLSALFMEECTVKDGHIEQTNFNTYDSMRIAQMPKVESIIMPSGGFWGGVGEPTICVTAPAVLNAVYAATGKPVRTLQLGARKAGDLDLTWDGHDDLGNLLPPGKYKVTITAGDKDGKSIGVEQRGRGSAERGLRLLRKAAGGARRSKASA